MRKQTGRVWSDFDVKLCSRKNSLYAFREERGIIGNHCECLGNRFSQSYPCLCPFGVCGFSAKGLPVSNSKRFLWTDAEVWAGCWHNSVVGWGPKSQEWLLYGSAPSK